MSGAWRSLVGVRRAAQIKSLAVLPLQNLSGNPEEDYFVDGMTEALLTELGKVSSLRVVSRQSVMQYKRTTKTVPQIARELGVDALVEGSVLRSGQKVRVSTQLILAVPERHLWSESYERDLTDVIARAKAAATKALEIDETQSEAHAALGLVKLNHEWDWEGAEREFRRAIELNPGSIDAHARYASYLVAMSRFDEALGEGRRALALDPLSAYTNCHLGWICANARRYDEAVDQFERTLTLDPDFSTARLFRAWCYSNLGVAFIYGVTGRRDEALRIIENVKILATKEYTELALAYERRTAQMCWVNIEPFFDPIRSHPRFREIIARMNFPPSGVANQPGPAR